MIVAHDVRQQARDVSDAIGVFRDGRGQFDVRIACEGAETGADRFRVSIVQFREFDERDGFGRRGSAFAEGVEAFDDRRAIERGFRGHRFHVIERDSEGVEFVDEGGNRDARHVHIPFRVASRYCDDHLSHMRI